MVESILNSIKKMLGIPTIDTGFDVDIIININSAFMVLHQLGVGSETAFSIQDAAQVWSEFLSIDPELYEGIKTYIYLKTKLVFDPPGTSFHLDAISKQILELEWRLAAQVPIPPEEPVVPEP